MATDEVLVWTELSTGIPKDEEVEPLPLEVLQNDFFFQQRVRQQYDGEWCIGQFVGIDIGVQTQERLYRVLFEDGDMAHFTALQNGPFRSNL